MKNQWKTLILLAATLVAVLLYASLAKEEIRIDTRITKVNIKELLKPRDRKSVV